MGFVTRLFPKAGKHGGKISLAIMAGFYIFMSLLGEANMRLLFFVLFLGAGVYLFLHGFSTYGEKKMIEAVPTTAIEGIAMGLTEIVGKVVRFPKEKLMTSPITNKKCVYWRVYAQQLQEAGSGKRRRTKWVTLYDIEKGIRFYLKDKTGQVLVDSKGASVDLRPDISLYGRGGAAISLRIGGMKIGMGTKSARRRSIDTYLRKYTGYPKPGVKKPRFAGLYKKGSLAYKKKIGMFSKVGDMRYHEYVIEPKDKLYILGTAGDNPFVKETTALKAVKDIMVQKGELEKLFIISDKSEKEILRQYGMRVWFEIIVGMLLILAMTALIGGQLL